MLQRQTLRIHTLGDHHLSIRAGDVFCSDLVVKDLSLEGCSVALEPSQATRLEGVRHLDAVRLRCEGMPDIETSADVAWVHGLPDDANGLIYLGLHFGAMPVHLRRALEDHLLSRRHRLPRLRGY